MAADRVRARKGFEYKMSKKVAELTQVVHMLFMRNHEREVSNRHVQHVIGCLDFHV